VRETAENLLVVSIGCPAGVGPEVSLAAAARTKVGIPVLVGDAETIAAAAELVGVSRKRLIEFDGAATTARGKIYVCPRGPKLTKTDRRPGKPSRRAGAAQLAWIDAAYDLVRSRRGSALVTGPVSKEAIARSGAAGADRFVGHTEWLCARDAARSSVMCFAAKELVTSLVTTHLPLSKVPRALSARGVEDATLELAELLHALGKRRPKLIVCSLNPHAGEGELFGDEERRAISPGIERARQKLGKKAAVLGPIGAETAFRKARAGVYDGVVAMYHDQATIPLKLLAFGQAVNVTMGLSIVRTSVDHGTAYDIAWRGRADDGGMLAAMELAFRLARRE
jgi:4-hydroxythreonine-4-phosphate dehydrogenase